MIKDLLGIPGEMVHHDYCEKEDFRTDEEVREFMKRSSVASQK